MCNSTAPTPPVFSGERISPEYRLKRWQWDVFVCHAGPDKAFARMLHDELVSFKFRCFVDEESLRIGGKAYEAMEAAVRSTYIAIVLLCEEFFHSDREAPQRELRWFLDDCKQNRNQVVPVFMGITVKRCGELASPLGLAAVTGMSGVRHASERNRLAGMPVHEEATMKLIIQSVCNIIGMPSKM